MSKRVLWVVEADTGKGFQPHGTYWGRTRKVAVHRLLNFRADYPMYPARGPVKYVPAEARDGD